MSSGEPPPPAAVTVLLADGDAFEAAYIGEVLRGRGITVLGPIDAPESALATIGAAMPSAAVIGYADSAANAALAAELERCCVPFIVLSRSTAVAIADETPHLARPFAAYQVADWVELHVQGGQR